MKLKFKTKKQAENYKKFVIKSQKKFGLKCKPKVGESFSYIKGKKEPFYYVLERCKKT